MAEMKVKSTTWRGSPTFTPKIKSGGSWETFTGVVKVKISGNWIRVWPPGTAVDPPLSISVSPSMSNQQDTTSPYDYSQIFSANPLGGDESYTYVWSFVSNPGGFSFSGSTTSATATVIKSTTTGPATFTASIKCVVTDGIPDTADSNTVNITFGTGVPV